MFVATEIKLENFKTGDVLTFSKEEISISVLFNMKRIGKVDRVPDENTKKALIAILLEDGLIKEEESKSILEAIDYLQ